MSDLILIQFLWNLLVNLITGTEPGSDDYAVLNKELFKRGITEKEDDCFWGTY